MAILNSTGILLFTLVSTHLDNTINWVDHHNPEILAVLLSSFSGFVLGKLYQKSGFDHESDEKDDGQACANSTMDFQELDKLVITGTFERNFQVIREDAITQVLYVQHLLEKKQYRLLKIQFTQPVQKNDIFQLVTSSTKLPTYVTSWLEREGASGDLTLFIQYE
jgi:hypothetical protein